MKKLILQAQMICLLAGLASGAGFFSSIGKSIEATELSFYQTVLSFLVDDRFRTVKEIVEENGFAFEEHTVITEDGYILTLHRIRQKDANNKRGKLAPAVLF